MTIPVDHPEAFCDRCGQNNVTWFAPSDLWNRAVRGTPEYEHHGDPMLCPTCFIHEAEAVGISGPWLVTLEPHPREVVQRADQVHVTPASRPGAGA